MSAGEGLQVWNLTNCKLRASLVGHTGYINTVTVSPDGSLCASGGKARPRSPANLTVYKKKRSVRTRRGTVHVRQLRGNGIVL